MHLAKVEKTHPSKKLSRGELLRARWKAARPAFYIATLIPLSLGYIIAGKQYDVWRPGLFAIILLACFFLHLGANLSNDLFDFLSGTDTEETIGGSGAIHNGAISIPAYKRILVILYIGAFLLGAAGAMYTGYRGIWGIILFAIFSSLFYVAPPIRYGYHALGEVFVFINMGLVMTAGCTYALTGEISLKAIAVSIPVGLMVAGILYFQSMPEIETDKAAGKNTLANVLGPEKAVWLFTLWWPVIWALLLLLWATKTVTWPVALGVIASIPLFIKAKSEVLRALDNNAWLPLDAHGHYVRKMYLLCGLSLVAAVAIQ